MTLDTQAPTLVSNDVLRRLANGNPLWPYCGFSQEEQAMLVMILPDLAAEVLASRASDETQLERIEAMTQHLCDELASTIASIDMLQNHLHQVAPLAAKGAA
ncbi:MAG: hypothetical protein AAFN94_00720 [Pseudomonadota bacterium]